MRREAWVALSIAVMGVGFLAYTLRDYPLHGQVTAANPGLTAKVAIDYFGQNGKLTRTETWTEAVSPDGSVARIRSTVNGRPDPIGVILDVAKASRIAFDPLGKTVTTYHLKTGEVKGSELGRPSCAIPLGAESEIVLGYLTYHFKESYVVGTKSVKEERWVAPTLDCFPLERSYDVWDSGQYQGRTVGHVVSLTVGIPHPSLFEVPKGYVERAPTDAMATHAEKLGQKCGACSSRSGFSLDQVYESHQ